MIVSREDIIFTTLKQIRAYNPCGIKRDDEHGYNQLRKNLGLDYGEDTPITFKQIYDSNGYSDALWCLRTVDEKYHPLLRHFAVDCAEKGKHLMKDERSLKALEVARLYADGLATDGELATAKEAAWNAAWNAASDAAKAAAWNDAWAAARNAAWNAAWAAASDAAKAAARNAAHEEQIELLFKYCHTGKRVI